MKTPYERLADRLKKITAGGKQRIEKTRLRVYWNVGRAIERVIFQGVDPQESLDQAQEECTSLVSGQ